MSKQAVYAWRFNSSSGDKVYETLQYEDGTTSCDCPGWTRRAIRDCKHTRAVRLGDANLAAIKHGPLTGAAPMQVKPVSVASPVTPVQTSFEREFS